LAYCGNSVGHINKVKLRQARLALILVTTFGVSTVASFPGPLSLAIHPGVGATSLAMASTTAGGRNGKFCEAVGRWAL